MQKSRQCLQKKDWSIVYLWSIIFYVTIAIICLSLIIHSVQDFQSGHSTIVSVIGGLAGLAGLSCVPLLWIREKIRKNRR